ncbi:MAG: Smr/MutS family protein [Saprospiraceae bacterium]|nr:Smr/MutS family protein [Saprospiraceae bacterium]MCF8250386.1 Smr/MutS family protein [Saprospiraceae bacterium]MCF8281544.1 Smr/MutS family protein [Bacteroidales bacterium]MCF8312239.1 Smr/MutS family protein [Saprospiraceae bacterium]MCF8440580.1 Smr/MutS family protein [Saprospiraceae bacterium]
MLFAIGTKVKFRHTDDEGEVKALLDGGMVSVYLPKYDMEIPTHPDDLFRAEERLKHPVKAKVVEGKKEVVKPVAPPVSFEMQYTILKSLGIQLVFEPIETKEEVPEKYTMYLLNDTRYDVVFELKLFLNSRGPQTWSSQLKSVSYQKLGEFLYDDLNESPEFEVECHWVTTEGLSPEDFKSLKIKPKTFFGNLRTAPFLNKPVHWYRLFEKPEKTEETSSEDLESYTKRHTKPVAKQNTSSTRRVFHVPDSNELAAFNPEIDLHIEKLTDNWRKLTSGDILKIQLSHFETFISNAIRLGVERVFVIHGVGEGKLRNAIATRLMQNPEINTFKNEFHHRYGWGATEVIF